MGPYDLRREIGTARLVALLIAFVWSAAILVGAFTVPAYSSDGSGAGSQTLVGENGTGVAVTISVPLAVTAIVATSIWRRRRAAGPGAVAWTLTSLLAAFNVLAMLTIGVFVLPVTVALVVACLQGPAVVRA